MARFTLALLAFAAATAVSAAPNPLVARETSTTCGTINSALSGSANAGTGAGTQFITGQCLSPADCASGCCVSQSAALSVCKARIVTEEAGQSCDSVCVGGSGVGVGISSGSNTATKTSTAVPAAGTTAASSSPASGACVLNSSAAGSQNVGTGAGTQFITGQCFSRADCASSCCVGQTGGGAQCKAQVLTEQQGLSCDFTCST